MKILITGASGFIGKNLRLYLSKKNHQIIGVDRKADPNGLLDVSLIDLSSNKEHELPALMKDCDLVIHCAGKADVQYSHLQKKEQFDDNLVSTQTVLDCMVQAEVKNIIFLSTAVVNGTGHLYFCANTGNYEPYITEEGDTGDPISMYATTKKMAEQLIRGYSKNFGLRSLIIRLENIAGPHYSHGVVLDFINKLKKDPSKLKVMGNGQQRKAFLHVKDLCSIIDTLSKEILFKMVPGDPSEIFNVGNLNWIFVSEIAGIVCDEMNLSPEISYGSETGGFKGDVPIILMSKNKMLSFCKKPKLSSRQAVRDTARWIINDQKKK